MPRVARGTKRFIRGRAEINFLLAFLLLGFKIALETGSAKAADEGSCVTDQWIEEPKEFVLEVTNTSFPDVCIRIVSQQRLNLAFGLTTYDAAGEPAAGFLPESAEIFLAENFDSGMVSRGVTSSTNWSRTAMRPRRAVDIEMQLENEAYFLQVCYLRRHRLKQEAFLFKIMGMIHGACEIDY